VEALSRVYKTKEFSRYCRREAIDEKALGQAVERAERGLIDADLGGGLIKQRVARPGQGRSGGYRTIMAFRSLERTVFLYGFAKSERANIGPDELEFWRKLASGFLTLNDVQLEAMIEGHELTEVMRHD
jgi:hypothetical protein